MIQKFLIRLLFKLTDRAFKITYLQIDKTAIEKWLFQSYQEKGFLDYYRLEDLRLLKAIGMGEEGPKHWIYIGRRLQLLNLYGEMQKAFELKKTRDEKARAEQAKKGGESSG
jgi:hypothetical protein